MNGTGTNYADAFFDINYVKVFGLTDSVLEPSIAPGGTTVLVSATASPTAGNTNTNGSGSGSGNGGSGSDGGNGAAQGARVVGATVVGAGVVAAFAWALM